MKSIFFCILLLLIQTPVLAKGSYILGPGDKVEIKVFGQKNLTVETLLSNSGQINYPFFGEIKVTGLTVKQVEQLIYNGLKGDYLVNPNVYVHVVEYRPFYIHGEVNKPGGYSYQPGLTVNQAIALAGGLTERASKQKIYLFKEKNKNTQINASLTYKVNAGDTILIKQRFF
ncbi:MULTISPECIES: polysaccharide biosynthesis/export family protein [unclassified Moritella]|uniref:polysaccharide biosynthesis/export family protein n=1 Tax=unclassified Moritella TaxID=2637987 RepID=UPI001BA5F883|nr:MULTISPECIES: polysaccharide biosynthesis/export family protein [unclassified Moritella]QUM85001.1 polysaccharide export protein [Moritella sp. 28]QUM89233.1 polysaccharide export protein [Moritella sp. 36]